jgi:hypothetical protein
VEARDHLVVRDFAALEEDLHQRVVAFGNHLDQFRVVFPRLLNEVGGNVAGRRLARGVLRVPVGLHGDEVDDTLEAGFAPQGDLDRHRAAVEPLEDRLHRPLERRVLSIELVDDEDARDLVLLAILEDPLRDDLDAGNRLDDEERRVGNRKPGLRICDEGGVTRGVDEIDLRAAPFQVRQRGLQRDLSVDFLVVEVGGRRAVVNATQAVDRSRDEQQRGHERRLPAVAMADESDVSDIRRVVDLHAISPAAKACRIAR